MGEAPLVCRRRNHRKASPRQDQMGGWEVGLDFTSEGAQIFADLTDRVAQMSDPVTGQPGRMAIVLDGQLRVPLPSGRRSMVEVR